MSIAYICEPNPVILQDLREILQAFDATLQIEEIMAAKDLALIDVLPGNWSFAIVNGNSATYAEIEFIKQYQVAGGQVLCIGPIGPSQTPPPEWILVQPPFTTGSIHVALEIAREARAKSFP